jgi:chemotaxis protein MotA
MDIATIVGSIAGLIVILVAIFLGGDFGTFVNVPSLLIVVGGGFSVTVMRYPLSNVVSALAMGAKIAFTHKKVTPKDKIDKLVELAELVRKDGPLALENAQIDDVILKKGSQMVADGYEEEMLVDILERERDLYLQRLDEASRIYKQLGDAAPAFGMIGTLVGLVQMLSTMDDPSAIGPSMAVALLTTLYGAVLANVIALPIADKLSTKGKLEEVNQTLTIDGVSHLRANRSPQLIKEMLLAYLPEKERHIAEMEMAAG